MKGIKSHKYTCIIHMYVYMYAYFIYFKMFFIIFINLHITKEENNATNKNYTLLCYHFKCFI